MKYIVLIIDGAAGLPLTERGGKTCLELAVTPNLDEMATGGFAGLVRTVPPGMEPSSACACMSVLGYDPAVYYRGRASIEAKSLGIDIGKGEVVFRCNLVNTEGDIMRDYSAGHIGTDEAKEISYRHILKIKGHEDTLKAVCTPPHDIPGMPVADFLPKGEGGDFLRDLMARSETLLRGHRINIARLDRGDMPVTTIWLFWGSGQVPEMPAFREVYGLDAALTSGVDLLKGLAKMADIEVLDIRGVTDGPDNDNAAQITGALDALGKRDLAVVHIEAPDEAAHGGMIDEKVEAIQKIDAEVIGRLLERREDDLRVLVMPDHPTPIKLRTHSADPVPFLIWGKGVQKNGAKRFTEAEAQSTGVFIDKGYNIMGRLVGR